MTNRYRTLVAVDAQDIAQGNNTASGNPVCRAIRKHGWRGARIQDGTFIHLYDGKEWMLTLLPKAAHAFLMRYLKGKAVMPLRFELKHEPKGGAK